MRSPLMVALLFIEALTYGQGFNERYDALEMGNQQVGFNVELVGDGYAVISNSMDVDSIAPNLWLTHASVVTTRVDPSGGKLWDNRMWKPMRGTYSGWANCCDTIPQGGYVVGATIEDTTGLAEVCLMCFNTEGDTLWTRVFGGPTMDHYWRSHQVKRTSDGGFLIVGDRGINIQVNGNDAFAIKTDSLGNEQWRRTYGVGPPQFDGFVSCDIAHDGTYYFGGTQFPTDENGQRWVMHTDTLGNVLWQVLWGGPFSEGATQVVTASDGHILVFSGYGYAVGNAAMRPYMAKLDSANGSVIWEHQYGPTGYTTLFFAGKECSNGDLIGAGGAFVSQGPDTEKGLLVRASANGDSLWMFTYFYQDSVLDNGQGRFYDVLPTNDGGFIAAGVTRNPPGAPLPPGYSQDTWVVKVDGNGCIVPGCNNVGITEQATNLLDALTIFPNPARGHATARLTLPPSVAHLPLQLSMVGMDGRVVYQQRIIGNGEHELALEGMSSGVYYIHIASEGKWLTGGKLVVE